jgi:hypothetical protein
MVRASQASLIGFASVAAALLLLAACDDQVKVYRMAATVRDQMQSALNRIEAEGQVPGLQHHHVSVEPDSSSGGFAIKIYDLQLGDAAMGFQSFGKLTFLLRRSDATHLVAQDFEFTLPPVTQGPKAATGMLIDSLTRAMSVLQTPE